MQPCVRPFALGLAAFLALSAVQGAAPASARPFTVKDLVTLDRVSDPFLSPDGRYLAYQVRETDYAANKGINGIWLLDLATKDAAPKRLTPVGTSSASPRWSADGTSIYYLSAQQVWRVPAAGGAPQQVTKLPLDVDTFLLSPDGKRLVVALDVFNDCDSVTCTKERLDAKAAKKASGQQYDQLFVRHWDQWVDGRRKQLFALTLGADGAATGEPVLLTKKFDGDVPSKPFGDDGDLAFTPDGKQVIFSARIAGKTEAWNTNSDLFRVSADGKGTPENLTEDNPASDAGPTVSPDGKLLAYRAMQRPGYESDRFTIRILDLATGKKRDVASKWDRSPDRLVWSADGKTLFATADDLGQKPIFAIDVASGEVSKLTGAFHVGAFAIGRDRIVYSADALDRPPQLFRADLDGKNATQLTELNKDKLADIQFGQFEQFSFKGWNDETVYGYVVKPENFQPGKKYPLAFIIHGGPHGSFANLFHYRWNAQTYAGQGFATVVIDFHGSTGYGQAFSDSITGEWGTRPLEDLQKGLKAALARYDFLDGDRACALGASYGGFMINWIAGNWQSGFKCLVMHDGVFDNRMMGYSTEELWFSEWENKGREWEQPANYEKFNPVHHVGAWKVPMLVIQGGKDFRVPAEQGIATFTALQRRGIPSQFLYFPDENHWVLKPHNSVQWHEVVEAWLKRWTGGEGSRS